MTSNGGKRPDGEKCTRPRSYTSWLPREKTGSEYWVAATERELRQSRPLSAFWNRFFSWSATFTEKALTRHQVRSMKMPLNGASTQACIHPVIVRLDETQLICEIVSRTGKIRFTAGSSWDSGFLR